MQRFANCSINSFSLNTHNNFINQISSDLLHYQCTLPNPNQRYTNR